MCVCVLWVVVYLWPFPLGYFTMSLCQHKEKEVVPESRITVSPSQN